MVLKIENAVIVEIRGNKMDAIVAGIFAVFLMFKYFRLEQKVTDLAQHIEDKAEMPHEDWDKFYKIKKSMNIFTKGKGVK